MGTKKLTERQMAALRRVRNFNGLLIGGAYDDKQATNALLRDGLVKIDDVYLKITPTGLAIIGERPAA